MTWDDMRALALALPGAEDSSSFRTPAIKIKGKLLARLREDGETVMIRCEFGQRDMLIQMDPAAFYTTDHYKDYQSVLVRLVAVRRDTLQDLLEWGWTIAAPKSLQKVRKRTGS